MEAWKKNTGRTNYFRKVLMPQRINRDSLVLLYQLPTVVPMFNVILALLADYQIVKMIGCHKTDNYTLALPGFTLFYSDL